MAAELYRALASDARLKIVNLLEKRELSLSELASDLGVEPQTALFHLRILEKAGLVSSAFVEGRRRYFLESRDILERLIPKERPPRPPKHKPPHEIVEERFEIIDAKLDEIARMIMKLSAEVEERKRAQG